MNLQQFLELPPLIAADWLDEMGETAVADALRKPVLSPLIIVILNKGRTGRKKEYEIGVFNDAVRVHEYLKKQP